MNSSHSQTHGLGKVKETKVIEAQMHPLEGNFSGDQTLRVVGLVDSHGDILVPLLNSTI